VGIPLRRNKVETAVKITNRKGVRIGLVAGLVATGLVGVTSLTASGSGASLTVSYGTLTLSLTDRAGSLTLVRAPEFGGGTFTQALGVAEPCSTLVAGSVLPSGTGNLLNFSAAVSGGSSPNVQLPSNGIGVTDGANCGVPAGLVGPGETLTLDLGGFLPADVIVSTGTLRIGKSQGNDGQLKVAYDSGSFGGNISVGVGVTPVTVADTDGQFRRISIRSTANQSSRGLSLRTNTVFTLEAPAQVTAPGAPTNVAALRGNGQATVTWDAPDDNGGSDITGYKLEYRATGSTEWIDFPTTATSSQTVTGLINGTEYTFRVATVNDVGTSTFTESNPVTPATAPGAPTNVAALRGNGQATVTWDAPDDNGGSDITGYKLEYRATGSTEWIDFPTTATSSQTVTGLINGTEYTFRVATVNDVGTSTFTVSNPVTPATAPGAPTNVRGQGGAKQVQVEWEAPLDDGGLPVTYELRYFNTTTPGTLTTVTVVPDTATSQLVTGLADGTEYVFEVRALNDAGESGWTPSDPVTTFALPVDCGATVEATATGAIATKVLFQRGENENKPGPGVAEDCLEVDATVKIVNDPNPPDDVTDYVFWDNTFEDINGEIQRVNATVTINWTPVLAEDAVELNRLIDYDGPTGPGPYRETLWCESFTQTSITPAIYVATLPDWTYDTTEAEALAQGAVMVNGELKAPWCLVSDTRIQEGGFISQTEVLFGSGDPSRTGSKLL
jgi:hypothetical protein